MAFNTTDPTTLASIPVNNLMDTQSHSVRDLFYYAGIAFELVLSPSSILAALVTNIINIAVFSTLGRSDGINQNFLILSLSDAIQTVVLLLNTSAHILERFVYTQGGKAAEIVQGIYWTTLAAGPYPHAVSIVTTIVIAVVRCLCVAMPLRVKKVLTLGRQLVAILICSLIVWGVVTYAFSSARLVRLYDPRTNTSRVAYVGSNFYLYDFFTNIFLITSFSTAVACVVVLTLNLKKASEFRKEANLAGEKAKNHSRDTAVIQSVVLVCVMFIIGYIPLLVFNLMRFFWTGFSHQGPYSKMYRFFFPLMETFLMWNSSVNIFIYYHFNSKFRNKLMGMFRIKHSEKLSVLTSIESSTKNQRS